MPSRTSTRTTGTKISQLAVPQDGRGGYAYYCRLCDEVLALSGERLHPRKVRLLFDDVCPSCGFNLPNVLRVEATRIPSDKINPSVHYPITALIRPQTVEPNIRKTRLLAQFHSDLTTGVEALDKLLVLRFGQFVALQGRPAHNLSLLLCVRATLPHPLGPDSDVIFIDGGNIFDAYAISEQSTEHDIDSENVLNRIHLSRAFTYHQLTSLITDKLPSAITEFSAKLAVISDINQLYCDPDIRGKDKQDALRTFTKAGRSLADLAEQKAALVVATNLEPRDVRMERVLTRSAHVTAKFEESGTLTRFTLIKHPWIPQRNITMTQIGLQTLESYL